MKENRNCKIVQDLLPSYIEKLTSEESNKFVEQHLGECNECKEILENMKKDLKVNTTNKEKKAIKYLKKYKNKLRILKIIILIILVIFIGNTTRKMMILSDISNKAERAIDSENYHRILYNYNKDSTSITEIWGLEEKRKMIMTNITSEGTKTVTMYANKKGKDEWGNEIYNTNIYTVTENSKTAKLNLDMGISVDPQNMVYMENFWQLFLLSIPSSIKSTTYDGEECYYIANLQSMYSFADGMYVSKNTGLTISTIGYEVEYSDSGLGRWPAADYVYEFNTVTEKDFIEPNIDEYTIE